MQERLHIKIVNKFIKVKNFESYWSNQIIDHRGSKRVEVLRRAISTNGSRDR